MSLGEQLKNYESQRDFHKRMLLKDWCEEASGI